MRTYVFPDRPPFPWLWPVAPFAPVFTNAGRRNSERQGGLDVGAVREVGIGQSMRLEVLTGAGWMPLLDEHKGIVRSYYRWGGGYSGGPGAHNIHLDPQQWLRNIRPEIRSILDDPVVNACVEDIDYWPGYFRTVVREHNARFGYPPLSLIGEGEPVPPPEPPKPPKPPTPPPPAPPPPTSGLPPLSPASQRVEELRALLLQMRQEVRDDGVDDLTGEAIDHLGAIVMLDATWRRLRPMAVIALRYFRRARQALGDPRPLPD